MEQCHAVPVDELGNFPDAGEHRGKAGDKAPICVLAVEIRPRGSIGYVLGDVVHRHIHIAVGLQTVIVRHDFARAVLLHEMLPTRKCGYGCDGSVVQCFPMIFAGIGASIDLCGSWQKILPSSRWPRETAASMEESWASAY